MRSLHFHHRSQKKEFGCLFDARFLPKVRTPDSECLVSRTRKSFLQGKRRILRFAWMHNNKVQTYFSRRSDSLSTKISSLKNNYFHSCFMSNTSQVIIIHVGSHVYMRWLEMIFLVITWLKTREATRTTDILPHNFFFSQKINLRKTVIHHSLGVCKP